MRVRFKLMLMDTPRSRPVVYTVHCQLLCKGYIHLVTGATPSQESFTKC